MHGWWSSDRTPERGLERSREGEREGSPNRYESFHRSTLNSYRSNSKGGGEGRANAARMEGRGEKERLERTTRRQCNYSQLPRPSAVRGIIPFCFHYWYRHSCLCTPQPCTRVNSCIGDVRWRCRRNDANSSRAECFEKECEYNFEGRRYSCEGDSGIDREQRIFALWNCL